MTQNEGYVGVRNILRLRRRAIWCEKYLVTQNEGYVGVRNIL